MFLLLCCIVYQCGYGSHWPLSSAMRNVLKMNSSEIVELLDTDDDLIEAVIWKGCFTREQLECVKGTTDERSIILLDKIARSTIATLNGFLHCLAVRRPNVVPLLSEEGKDLLNIIDFTK
jgi:hypothetical protein